MELPHHEAQPLNPDQSLEPATPAQAWDWTPTAQAQLHAVSVLCLQGPDSLRFLHGQSSQALLGSSPGQLLSTCCITPTARMRALAEVLVDAAGAWLMIHSGDGDAVRTALDRVLFPADELRLGPLQRAWLIQPLPLPADPPHHWRPLEGGQGFWLGNQLLLLTETEPAAGDASELQDLEPAARALLSLPRLDPQGRERLRLQWGEPAWPGEINDDTNPFELGLAPRVSLNKGCYVGQETLARLATYDGVRQQLRRWICVSDQDGEAQALALLTPGARLVSALGERAGAITSVLRLDGFTWIGLALVRRSALDQEMLVAATENPAAPPAEASEPPLVLRISRPERFCDPPVGAGGLS